MNRLTKTLLQLVADLENQLDSALKSCNKLDGLSQQLDECKHKNEDLMVQLQAAQRELEKPQQDLSDYQKTIRLLEDQLNTLKNTPPKPGSWDNRIVILPGYGTVLAIQLYEQGWPEAVINCLPCQAPTLVLSYSEWYRIYGQSNGYVPPEPPLPTPGLPSAPSVALSEGESHWMAVPDDESEAVEVAEVPRQRNRAKPEHNE